MIILIPGKTVVAPALGFGIEELLFRIHSCSLRFARRQPPFVERCHGSRSVRTMHSRSSRHSGEVSFSGAPFAPAIDERAIDATLASAMNVNRPNRNGSLFRARSCLSIRAVMFPRMSDVLPTRLGGFAVGPPDVRPSIQRRSKAMMCFRSRTYNFESTSVGAEKAYRSATLHCDRTSMPSGPIVASPRLPSSSSRIAWPGVKITLALEGILFFASGSFPFRVPCRKRTLRRRQWSRRCNRHQLWRW